MRILVVSDTHRDQYALEQAVLRQPKAEVVIHLGDGADEAEMVKAKFPEKTFCRCAATAIGVRPAGRCGDHPGREENFIHTDIHIM